MDSPSATVTCPYCWERVELTVDPSAAHQQYVEDCPVCCRPMEVDVWVDENGQAGVEARAGNG